MALPKVNRQLAVAALLGWIWAILMLLISIAVTIPALSAGVKEAVPMILPAALSVATAVAAHGVRRRRWPYVALGAAAAWIAFLVLVPVNVKISLPGIALNVAILGLVLTNLRQFR